MFQHYLLNDEQEPSEDLVFEYRNLVDNIKIICKQSNSNFKRHIFEEQIQKKYTALNKVFVLISVFLFIYWYSKK